MPAIDKPAVIQDVDSSTKQISTMKTHFAQLLTTNEAPSEHNIAMLKTALAQWMDELQEIQRTINTLDLTLSKLHEDHNKVESLISVFSPILAHARRIPDDVLSEIFYHCLPSHHNPAPLTYEAPLSLTCVCQQWRGVALSSPRLWKRLHISAQITVTKVKYDPDGLFAGKWQLRLEGIKSWIARSCKFPLSISMKGIAMATMDRQSNVIEHEIIQLIVDHASRLKRLELCLPRETLNAIHKLIDISPSTLPMLRALKIVEEDSISTENRQHSADYRPAPEAPRPLHSWLSLPSLQDFHFGQHNEHLDGDTGANAIPLPLLIQSSHLTRLSLYRPTKRNIVVDILRNCLLLEECHVSIDANLSHPTTDFSLITLPKLRCLWIEMEDGVSPDSLFRFLDVPSLVSLSLFPVRFGNSVMDFLNRCASLDKIATSPYKMDPRFFLDILQSTPNITQLILDNRKSKSGQNDGYFSSPLRKQRPIGSRDVVHASLFQQKEPRQYPLVHLYVDGVLSLPEPRLLPRPLVPCLKSFTAIMTVGNICDNPHNLLQFLKNRIHPLPSTSCESDAAQTYPTASLESVVLVLDAHPEMRSDTRPRMPIDLAEEVARHAELVGRTIGVDISLAISYPWKELYELQERDRWKVPNVLLSVKEGLGEEEDYYSWLCGDDEV